MTFITNSSSFLLLRLAPVLKTIFHQCVISYTCSQSNADGSVLKYSAIGFFLPFSYHEQKITTKNVAIVGTPPTKQSGSAHVQISAIISYGRGIVPYIIFKLSTQIFLYISRGLTIILSTST